MAQNIGYWQLQSKNNGLNLQKLISDEPLVCVWVGDKCGQQNVSKQRKMDRQRKGHCCLSIHLRCMWKSSTMTAHPSATGVLLSLLEQNQKPSLSIMHHFSPLLFPSVSHFCLSVVWNIVFFWVGLVLLVRACSVLTSGQSSALTFGGEKIGYGKRAQETCASRQGNKKGEQQKQCD